jgi:hypothetical protein
VHLPGAYPRHFNLSQKDTELALKNALRYIPAKWHQARWRPSSWMN